MKLMLKLVKMSMALVMSLGKGEMLVISQAQVEMLVMVKLML